MPRLFILIIFFAFSLFPHMGLADNMCPNPRTNLVVQKVKKDVEYVHGMSIRDMTQIHTGSVRHRGPAIYGLGGGRVGLTVDMDFHTREIGNGLTCLSAHQVVGNFIAFPAIAVANDLRRGTCEYNAVMEHEKKHVAELMRFQDRYAPKFKSHLKKLLRTYAKPQVVPSSQAATAQARIKADIDRAVGQYFLQIAEILSDRQQKIDSAEEYRRVFAACKNWARETAPRLQRRYR